MLTVGSLFSGIGGFDLGLERAGLRVVWQCEKDEAARRVLARRWPDVTCYPDVRDLDGREPTVDVLCGGFPCQDLSVAGRRAGLAGERSGLFHEFMRIAAELAPRWVLVKNVPGLLSSNDGRDMGVVLGVLADLGYGWCYRVLDAQWFGVAQRRRRVFIIGCLGDARRAAQVLLEPQSCERHPAPSREAGEGVAGTLGGGSGSRGWAPDTDRMTFVPAEMETAGTLRSHPRPGSNSVGALAFMWQAGGKNDASGALEHDMTPTMPRNQTIAVAYNPYRTLEKDGTVTSGFAARPVVDALHGPTGNKEPLVADTMAVRRLMPIECERLQGFPDNWTDEETDSARYRMLGNAICVPVAQWIGNRLAEVA